MAVRLSAFPARSTSSARLKAVMAMSLTMALASSSAMPSTTPSFLSVSKSVMSSSRNFFTSGDLSLRLMPSAIACFSA